MKKLFFGFLVCFSILAQAQINHYFYLKVEDGEKFESTLKEYWLKVAQHATDNGGMQGWSVWKKVRKTDQYNYIVAFHFKDIDQLEGDWGVDGLAATGIDSKHISNEWNVFRSDTYRIHSGVPGSTNYIVVNYSKPDQIGKQLTYEIEYITPVMKELISKKAYGRTSWNVQHKIYPSSSNEKYSMLTVDGYASMVDAMKSFDFQYGVDNSGPWTKALKKVHGDKTMETSENNAFGYRPIYKYLFGTD